MKITPNFPFAGRGGLDIRALAGFFRRGFENVI